MTWQSFFDISTMAHRHLVLVYGVVLGAHLAYVGRIAWGWAQAKPSRP
jgi:hypothetical protein